MTDQSQSTNRKSNPWVLPVTAISIVGASLAAFCFSDHLRNTATQVTGNLHQDLVERLFAARVQLSIEGTGLAHIEQQFTKLAGGNPNTAEEVRIARRIVEAAPEGLNFQEVMRRLDGRLPQHDVGWIRCVIGTDYQANISSPNGDFLGEMQTLLSWRKNMPNKSAEGTVVVRLEPDAKIYNLRIDSAGITINDQLIAPPKFLDGNTVKHYIAGRTAAEPVPVTQIIIFDPSLKRQGEVTALPSRELTYLCNPDSAAKVTFDFNQFVASANTSRTFNLRSYYASTPAGEISIYLPAGAVRDPTDALAAKIGDTTVMLNATNCPVGMEGIYKLESPNGSTTILNTGHGLEKKPSSSKATD